MSTRAPPRRHMMIARLLNAEIFDDARDPRSAIRNAPHRFQTHFGYERL